METIMTKHDIKTKIVVAALLLVRYGQFSNAPQSSDAQYKTTLFGPYTNWSNTKLVDKDCNNITNVYPYNSSKEVMTGDLKSGGSTTWDVNRMETYYPRC